MPESSVRAANRERLLEAAARLLRDVGFDRVTVNALADEAEVSRSTLYGHFGDVPGVYASLWADHGLDWLRRVMSGSSVALDEPPSAFDDACASLFVLARRVPAVLEVARVDLDRVWAEVATTHATALRAAWLVAGTVGCHLVRPVIPETGVVVAMMPWVASMDATLPAEPLADRPPRDHLGAVTIDAADDDDIEARLAAADMQVLASAGYVNATLMRICRVARVSTGAATPRFATLLDLHRYAFEAALSDVVRTNTMKAASLLVDLPPADVQAVFITAALEPHRRLWRQYRQELLLAARHDVDAAAMTRTAFGATSDRLVQGLRVADGTMSEAEFVAQFNVVFSAGMAAAAEMGVPIAEMDHRPATRSLYKLLQQHVGSA